MIAFIGKTLLYTLTAMGVISVGYTLLHPPRAARPSLTATDSTYLLKGCVHVQFAENRDSTFWQSDCRRPNHPWDTVIVRQPEP